jgi:hypothetical protein
MEKTAYLPGMKVRLECLLVEWEKAITALVIFCAIVTIVLGIVWMFLRKEILLFIVLGFSACYLIGRNFWRFRDKRFSMGT